MIAVKNAISHAFSNFFVTSTGIASFVHSAWVLARIMGGEAPQTDDTLAFMIYWAPSLLIAASLDIGQISVSVDIRNGQRTKAKYFTFACFSISAYFLNWLYIAHHMPALSLASGVRAEWLPIVTIIRDSALWLLPLALPLSTLLFTISTTSDTHSTASNEHHANARATMPLQAPPSPVAAPTSPLALPYSPSNAIEQNHDIRDVVIEQSDDTEGHIVHCPQCEWQGVYQSQSSAQRAIRAHSLVHAKQPLSVNAMSVNGAKSNGVHNAS